MKTPRHTAQKCFHLSLVRPLRSKSVVKQISPNAVMLNEAGVFFCFSTPRGTTQGILFLLFASRFICLLFALSFFSAPFSLLLSPLLILCCLLIFSLCILSCVCCLSLSLLLSFSPPQPPAPSFSFFLHSLLLSFSPSLLLCATHLAPKAYAKRQYHSRLYLKHASIHGSLIVRVDH